MIRRGQEKSKVVHLGGSAGDPSESLLYAIELWDSGRSAVERVLAKAFSAELAHAIFRAARREHPKRRITLRHGTRLISDSAE